MSLAGYSTKLDEIVNRLSNLAVESTKIDPSLYAKYDVKRGLRDVNGKGVPAGLTEISDIISSKPDENGIYHSCPGELYYRGININEIIDGFVNTKRHGFEEVTYLLLFGNLPTKKQLNEFETILASLRKLPVSFVRDIIMKAPSDDMMNSLGRSVLSMYYYDSNPDDTSIPNILKQCLQLIAQMPLITVYGYKAHQYYFRDDSLIIHQPLDNLGTAENLLHLMRNNSNYSELEKKLLDLLLIIHAEHGGGNNSTFTTHLVSSSGTDTYSCMAASLGSLKGPKHGGANIKVIQMIDDLKKSVKDYSEESIKDYLSKLLKKEVFDKTGLIYGMGHAVYSVSDPRAKIIKEYTEKLAKEKNMYEEYQIYSRIEKLAPEIIANERNVLKGVSANVDFFSGFAYTMLGIPRRLFTPLFAVSRIVGWSAHRIEEVSNNGKIIRPGYVAVAPHRDYIPIEKRK